MGSSSSYGYDKHYAQQRAIAADRLWTGVNSISDDHAYVAALALDQMKWKLNKLHLTREEYDEWRGFIDALSRVLPESRAVINLQQRSRK